MGVCYVRNRLIIHPEKRPEAVLTRSFQILPDKGMCLKPYNPDLIDKGFRSNAKEFREFMVAWKRAALLRLSSPRHS